MTPSEAEHIARILEQFHEMFGFAAHAFLPSNAAKTVGSLMMQLNVPPPMGGVVFGFPALAIVYSFEAVAKPLHFPASIMAEVKLQNLTIVQNALVASDAGAADRACFRHLRNCFAHGRYSVTVAGNVTSVVLRDFDQQKNQTFEASCDAQVVTDMAERILIAAHKEAAKLAPAAPAAQTAPAQTSSPQYPPRRDNSRGRNGVWVMAIVSALAGLGAGSLLTRACGSSAQSARP